MFSSLITSFASALILTYFLSRALLRAFATLRPWPRLLVAHLASLAALMIVVGFIKAYFSVFALDQTLILIVPQLIWLLIDVLRGKAEHAA